MNNLHVLNRPCSDYCSEEFGFWAWWLNVRIVQVVMSTGWAAVITVCTPLSWSPLHSAGCTAHVPPNTQVSTQFWFTLPYFSKILIQIHFPSIVIFSFKIQFLVRSCQNSKKIFTSDILRVAGHPGPLPPLTSDVNVFLDFFSRSSKLFTRIWL